MVDIKLKQWAEEMFPRKSVNIAWTVLKQMFRVIFENQKVQDADEILDKLKMAVIDEALSRHAWEDKVCAYFNSFYYLTKMN